MGFFTLMSRDKCLFYSLVSRFTKLTLVRLCLRGARSFLIGVWEIWFYVMKTSFSVGFMGQGHLQFVEDMGERLYT